MVRNGANLSAADKATLVAMNAELEGLFSAFSSKLLADEKRYTFVTDEADLAGLEPAFVASLADAAAAQGKPGQWAIKHTRASAPPARPNANQRHLRRRVWRPAERRDGNVGASRCDCLRSQIH